MKEANARKVFWTSGFFFSTVTYSDPGALVYVLLLVNIWRETLSCCELYSGTLGNSRPFEIHRSF